jgi:hypothetical protein
MATNKSQISDIDEQEKAAPVVEAVKATTIGSGIPGASGKRALLTIYSSNDSGGSDAVACGLNGYAFQIQRDVPVNVPEELVMVFKNSIVTHYVEGKPVDRPQYAFSSQEL